MQNRKKLDVTAEIGTLVGISEGTLCYKVYFHSKKNIVQTRYLTFIEEPGEHLFIDEPITVILKSQKRSESNHSGPNILAQKGRPRNAKVSKLRTIEDLVDEQSNDNSSTKTAVKPKNWSSRGCQIKTKIESHKDNNSR